MRVVARRRSSWRSRSARAWARTRLAAGSSSRPATRVTASSSMATTCGKASRKKPEMRTITSMRGRPSSARATTSRPVTRRLTSSQTGRTPSRASASATSSPWVRMAAVPHTDRPTDAGQPPVSSRWRASSESASCWPASQASRDGTALGSTA